MQHATEIKTLAGQSILCFVILSYLHSDSVSPEVHGVERSRPTVASKERESSVEIMLRGIALGAVVIDVRVPLIFNRGHIPKAVNMPAAVSEPPPHMRLLIQEAPFVVVYGQNSLAREPRIIASHIASWYHGDIYVYTGGWEEWQMFKLPVQQ